MSAESHLPRTADGTPAGSGGAPTGKAPTRTELQDEIARTRAELAATVDALSLRVSPAYQVGRAKQATATAASDARTLLSGGGLPADDAKRARNVKVLLAAAAVVAAVVAIGVSVAARSRR